MGNLKLGWPWRRKTPDWALQVLKTVRATHQLALEACAEIKKAIEQEEEHVMASLDDLKSQIEALKSEDGALIQAVNDLQAKVGSGGAVSDADLQGLVDTIRDEVTRVHEAVTATAEAAPADGGAATSDAGATGAEDTSTSSR